MKRSLLAVVMVAVVATPCLAQEVETDGLFRLHGTAWEGYGLSFITTSPFVWPNFLGMAFYEGDVYGLSNNASYIDLLVVSIVTDFQYIESRGWRISLGIMQPIGIGVYTDLQYTSEFQWGPGTTGPPAFVYTIGIMLKVENNWTPPPE